MEMRCQRDAMLILKSREKRWLKQKRLKNLKTKKREQKKGCSIFKGKMRDFKMITIIETWAWRGLKMRRKNEENTERKFMLLFSYHLHISQAFLSFSISLLYLSFHRPLMSIYLCLSFFLDILKSLFISTSLYVYQSFYPLSVLLSLWLSLLLYLSLTLSVSLSLSCVCLFSFSFTSMTWRVRAAVTCRHDATRGQPNKLMRKFPVIIIANIL